MRRLRPDRLLLANAGKAAGAEGDEQLEEQLDKLEEENLQLIEENSGLINKARPVHDPATVTIRDNATLTAAHPAVCLVHPVATVAR